MTVPVWQRIEQALAAELGRGRPGERLPTEAALAARFGVNRHTVRRAMEGLARRGLLRVERGRGAFVAEPLLDYTVSPRTRFSEWIRRNNMTPLGRVLRLQAMPASEAVAAGLALPPGAPVLLMERLGLADGEPVSLSAHYFPTERLPGIEAAFVGAGSVTEALARAGVPDYVRRSTRVSAQLPSPAEADLLHMPPDRPLLLCENVNVDPAGRVVEFGVARYPSTRVQIVFEP